MESEKTIKNSLKKKHLKGLALDIDETISYTVLHWFEELIKHFGNPENLSAKELIAKYRYGQNVPYWQSKEALNWMENFRRTSKVHENVPLIENSNHFVIELNKIVPVVLYLTTRPKAVERGTRKWLNTHKFPNLDVIFKPNKIPTERGNEWKAKVLEGLYPEIVGIIDDNPSLVQNLSRSYKGTVFLYDNNESPRKDLNIIPCKTWEDVLTKVKTFKLSGKK